MDPLRWFWRNSRGARGVTGEYRGARVSADVEGGWEAVPGGGGLVAELWWAVPGRSMRWRGGRAGARDGGGVSRGGGSFNGGRVHGKDG